MLGSLKARITSVLKKLDAKIAGGPRFRFYAPQSPPAPPGPNLRIAMVDLIPHLGDSVMLYALLDAICREHPAAEISVFAAGGAAEVLSLHPAVSHAYVHNPRNWKKRYPFARHLASPAIYEILRDYQKNYKDLRFDVCVVPRGGVDPFHSAHLAWMLGSKIRAGYSRQLEPENLGLDMEEDVLFTHLVRVPDGVHEVQRNVEALVLAGVLVNHVDIFRPIESLRGLTRSKAARDFIALWPQLASPYAIVAPGASTPRRRWTPEGFAELAQTELIDRKILPVFVGGPAERPLCESITAMLTGPSLILTGTTFVELVALTAGAELFLGNDSGPGHVAGALGVPTVEATAFARSGDSRHHAAPARSHPCGPHVIVTQPETQMAPCTTECVSEIEHCIAQIPVSEMRAAVQRLVAVREL